MMYQCCDERRRSAVRAAAGVNGIDFVEVVDSESATPAERQRVLRVRFLKSPAPTGLGVGNIVVEGGERIRDVRADAASYEGDVLVVHLTHPGDFSTYRLRLAATDALGHPLDQPAAGLDPLLAAVQFRFKAECPNEFDCGPEVSRAAALPPAPALSYLAKDYASFRQLMLDRLAVQMPQWQERNPADAGIALVEMLAYVGDQLSYRQDAVATEAYLGTARSRISVRRHARLVDYRVHEGSNARVFVHLRVSGSNLQLPAGTPFLTQADGQLVRIAPGSAALAAALAARPEVFETVEDAVLFEAHNELGFYTWGNARCWLPAGATKATLRGKLPALKPGHVLVFEEVLGPFTGQPADAESGHRHPVRLTAVRAGADPLGGRFATPAANKPVDITEIEWHVADALPFALCLSSEVREGERQRAVPNVSVARGNMVLCDHGMTVVETLPGVPQPTLYRVPPVAGRCAEPVPEPLPVRYRPRLQRFPLTHHAPTSATAPAASAHEALHPLLDDAEPAITLQVAGDQQSARWLARRDLLDSNATAPHFVVETESDGRVVLRFGDDRHGRRPETDVAFVATYRIGNGVRGNVAADAIAHAVSAQAGIELVRNPLPARGGVEPESIEHVRQSAPFAFRSQMRAVTAEDYVASAQRQPGVQRAAATLRWTGSWRTAFITVDRTGGLPVDPAFEADMRRRLEPLRLTGHDLEIDGPRFVALELELRVGVKADYFRSDVKAALLEVFSSRVLPNGGRGVFHPDNLSFAQPVYLSALYREGQAVEGVEWMEITTLQRRERPGREALDAGRLDLGRLEIAQLDNDPNYPDRGVVRITLEGGK